MPRARRSSDDWARIWSTIRPRWEAGATSLELAQEFGVSRRTIDSHVREFAWKRKPARDGDQDFARRHGPAALANRAGIYRVSRDILAVAEALAGSLRRQIFDDDGKVDAAKCVQLQLQSAAAGLDLSLYLQRLSAVLGRTEATDARTANLRAEDGWRSDPGASSDDLEALEARIYRVIEETRDE